MGFAEGVLDHTEFAWRRRKTLDCRDLIAIGLDREHQTGPNRLTIGKHRARPTDAVLAAGVGTVEQKILTQYVEQCLTRLNIGGTAGTVDAQIDFHRAPFPSATALVRACSSARVQSTQATRLR